MNNFVKTEDPCFVRDTATTALLNIDNAGFHHYMNERQRLLKMQQLQREVEGMKTDMSEIKNLLKQLVNGK